jgi:chemotaxis regulatin CheY-phosphate phosphatase CheZ
VVAARDTLGKDWNRKELDEALRNISGHLTNIIVAQEFQDLAGQALRKAMKALVGAIIVVEGGGPTEEQRMSQKEVDSMLKDLMA